MSSLVYFLNLYFSKFFFVILGIIGTDYAGAENNSSFVLGYMALDLLVLFFFLKHIIKYGIHGKEKTLISLIVVVLLIYVCSNLSNDDGINDGRIFIAETIPAILMAIIVAREGLLRKMDKYYDIAMLVVSLSLVLNFRLFLSGHLGLGTEKNYQALSYTAAFAYSLNIFGIALGKYYHNRYSFFKTKTFMAIEILLLPIQVLSCVLSGGRGGAIVIVVYTILALYYSAKWNKNGYTIIGVVVGLLIVLGTAISFIPKEYSDNFMTGFGRLFSYVTSNGIDMGATSNRDETYGAALKAFWESPILGYGLFEYADVLGFYPHNMFLSALVQGGLIYFFIFTMTFLFLLRKGFVMLKNSDNAILLILIFYPTLNLFFSGSYIRDANFFFVFCYLFLLSNKKVVKKLK